MHRSSLVRRAFGLSLGLALLALPQLGGPARAADKFTKVTFDTVDGVTIQGTYYPGKGRDEPTVLLLHKIGGDSHKDGWDDLAKALSEKGYNVLSFDFRGHGNSTVVDPEKFWKYPWNAAKASKGGPMEKGKLKDSINRETFTPGYYPYLINDIAAAKLFLDDRNDAGECNSRALILIGAEDGAALGALWMEAEWARVTADVFPNPNGPRFPPIIRNPGKDPAGKDQYCALWLSMTTSLGGKGSVASQVKTALRHVGRDHKLPMGFLYGDKDTEGEARAKEFVKVIKGETDAASDKYRFTDSHAISNTKLAGSALLRKGLGTDEVILKYLDKVRDKRVPTKWSKTDWDRTAYVWVFGARPVLAKEEKGKAFEPIPLAALNLGQ